MKSLYYKYEEEMIITPTFLQMRYQVKTAAWFFIFAEVINQMFLKF